MFCEVTVIGHIGGDPRPIDTQSGTPMTAFSLASEERYTDAQGQRQKRSIWHSVVCFNGRAQFAGERLKKGMLLFVKGRLRYNEFTDREGEKHRAAEIIADDIRILRYGNGGGAKEEKARAASA